MIKEIFELQNPWRKKVKYQFSQKQRDILKILYPNFNNKKIIGLIGSRQVGKSSILYLLISYLLKEKKVDPENIFYFNLDDLKLHELFSHITDFIEFVGKSEKQTKYIFIDEIQRLPNPGLILKELYDLNLNFKIIYTGSSQLELKSKVKEHLVGRARVFEIHRLSFNEFIEFNKPITKGQAFDESMIFGLYPEVSFERNYLEKKLLLKDIFQSYVQKDLTDYLKIENVEVFNKLLILLAMQISSLLNVESLSKNLRISRNIIEQYLQVLEKTFIIRRIYPFYKNYKKEIIKTPKLYFLDLGLRNFILNQFESIDTREDKGKLFENYYLLELLKNDFYGFNKINFWRTTNQTEIDFIVTGENINKAIETKWNKSALPKSFTTFNKLYPNYETSLVTKSDYLK
jgi:uncharacterized protein